MRLTLKLANTTWLVSDYAEGPTVDWHESEFAIAGIRWRRMNIETMEKEGGRRHFVLCALCHLRAKLVFSAPSRRDICVLSNASRKKPR